MARCFKHGIFHNKLASLFLEILQFVTRTRIYHIFFVGIISFPKTSKKCLSHLLIKTRLYLLPRTLLNYVTDDIMRIFWNRCTKKKKKKLGNIQKTYVVEFPLNTNAQIQSTAYQQTKTSTTDTFQKVLGKVVLKIQKFQNNLCKTVSFPQTLQACNPQILTSVKNTPRKVFSLSILKKLEVYLEKVYSEII